MSHDYWCATVRPDGRPHVMPVWGVWLRERLWFSSGLRSRKARNLAAEPRCTLTTDDAQNPVVVDGVARQVTDPGGIAGFVDAMNTKYGAGHDRDFLDPRVNGTFAVRPERVDRAHPRRLHRQPDPVDGSRRVSPAHTGMRAAPSALTLPCRTCGASRAGVPSTSDG